MFFLGAQHAKEINKMQTTALHQMTAAPLTGWWWWSLNQGSTGGHLYV